MMLTVTPLLIQLLLLLMSSFESGIIFNKPKVKKNYIRTYTAQKAQQTNLNQQTPFQNETKSNCIILKADKTRISKKS